eukprot:gene324-590_t
MSVFQATTLATSSASRFRPEGLRMPVLYTDNEHAIDYEDVLRYKRNGAKLCLIASALRDLIIAGCDSDGDWNITNESYRSFLQTIDEEKLTVLMPLYIGDENAGMRELVSSAYTYILMHKYKRANNKTVVISGPHMAWMETSYMRRHHLTDRFFKDADTDDLYEEYLSYHNKLTADLDNVENLLLCCCTKGHVFLSHYNLVKHELSVLNHGSRDFEDVSAGDPDNEVKLLRRIVGIVRRTFSVMAHIKIYMYIHLEHHFFYTRSNSSHDVLSREDDVEVIYREVKEQIYGNCWEIYSYYLDAFMQRPPRYRSYIARVGGEDILEQIQYPVLFYRDVTPHYTRRAELALNNFYIDGSVDPRFVFFYHEHALSEVRRSWKHPALSAPRDVIDQQGTTSLQNALDPTFFAELLPKLNNSDSLQKTKELILQHWLSKSSTDFIRERGIGEAIAKGKGKGEAMGKGKGKGKGMGKGEATGKGKGKGKTIDMLYPIHDVDDVRILEKADGVNWYNMTMFTNALNYVYENSVGLSNFTGSTLTVSSSGLHIRGYKVQVHMEKNVDFFNFLYVNDRYDKYGMYIDDTFDVFFIEHANKFVLSLVENATMSISLVPITQDGFEEDYEYRLCISTVGDPIVANFETVERILHFKVPEVFQIEEQLTHNKKGEEWKYVEFEPLPKLPHTVRSTCSLHDADRRESNVNYIRISYDDPRLDSYLHLMVSIQARTKQSTLWKILTVPKYSPLSTCNPYVSFPIQDEDDYALCQYIIIDESEQYAHINLPAELDYWTQSPYSVEIRGIRLTGKKKQETDVYSEGQKMVPPVLRQLMHYSHDTTTYKYTRGDLGEDLFVVRATLENSGRKVVRIWNCAERTLEEHLDEVYIRDFTEPEGLHDFTLRYSDMDGADPNAYGVHIEVMHTTRFNIGTPVT